MRRIPGALVLIAVVAAGPLTAQARTEANVVYGMYSGLALLMDVHHPARRNGYGVVFVAGSGWQAPLGYGAGGLKNAQGQFSVWGPRLLAAGYTVFAINHRAAPRFHFPAALEDVQRAVRFVRHNARQFGVDSARLGGVGGSSGGHLISLVAMLGVPGMAEDSDPANREPATLQTIVLRQAPSDLRRMSTREGTWAVVSFMERIPLGPDGASFHAAASPLAHVSASAPPALLLHGDADETVPIEQSVLLEGALQKVNVPVKLLRVAGGVHGPTFGTDTKPHSQLPALLDETVAWLDRYLKPRGN